MRFSITFIFILLAQTTIFGQTPNFKITNYTVDDGLPSNECHRIVQDSLGYIWIATDRGLVKWDGYEFEVWGSDKGLTDMSCIDLYKDNKENIWINTLTKGLFVLKNNSDSIVPYQFNNKILNLHGVFRFIERIAFDKKNNLIIHSYRLGTWMINRSGELKLLSPFNGNLLAHAYTIDKLSLIHISEPTRPY